MNIENLYYLESQNPFQAAIQITSHFYKLDSYIMFLNASERAVLMKGKHRRINIIIMSVFILYINF